jgi:hypothetical protein
MDARKSTALTNTSPLLTERRIAAGWAALREVLARVWVIDRALAEVMVNVRCGLFDL